MPSITLAPAIMDIEASGFSSHSYPIEIGVVLPDGNLYCSLIKPIDSWTHWDEKAQKVHGISRSTLNEFGANPHEVCQQLNKVLCGKTIYSDAWAWDSQWLAKLFGDAKVRKTFHLSSLELIATQEQLVRWDAEKQKVIEQCGFKRHRASSDAKVIQQTFINTHQAVK